MKNLILLGICLLLAIPSQAGIITVNWDGSGDYLTIQAAINAADEGDEIVVADGTYIGPGNRNIRFFGKAITVRSESGPEKCIIDCQRLGRGFFFNSDEDANSVVDGFTITNGDASSGGAIWSWRDSAPTIKNCIITDNQATTNGGAIFGYGGKITIVNCTITNNSAAWGGAIGNCGGLIDKCVISNNSATELGGGIDCQFSSPTISNCIISNNTVQNGRGGGVHCWRSTASLMNCTIMGNRVRAGFGGGICCKYRGNPTIVNCILHDNAAPAGTEIAVMHFHNCCPSIAAISYSNVKGGRNGTYVQSGSALNWGDGNIDDAPFFVDPGYWDTNGVWVEGDYHLLEDSPCIDAGNPNYIAEPNETDLDGRPRVIGGRIDMGAYEFQGPWYWYVDDNATGNNTGSSWADAYNYLQDALAEANSATKPIEIRVAQGIYTPDSNSANPNGSADRNATFQLINGVTLKGGYAGFGEPDPNARDIETYETILSGDLNGDDNGPGFGNKDENSYHVVTGSGTNPSAILNGFTITRAHAYDWPNKVLHGGGMLNKNGSPTLVDCTFARNSALDDGGGMYNENSNPTLIQCTFSDNFAYQNNGGGMYNYKSSPTLINCLFSGNDAYWQGGGMCNYQSNPTLENCTFTANDVMDEGSGMCNTESNPTLTNCIFSGNLAGWHGGGMVSFHSSPTLTNCTFNGNEAYSAGGMSNWWSNPTLTNCTFSGNEAYSAGGMSNSHSSPTLINCTFSRNLAPDGAGGMYNYTSSPRLTNCVFSSNHASTGTGGAMYNRRSSDMTLTNCTFAENSANNGNALACDSYLQQYPSNVQLANCILWDAGDEIWNNDNSAITIIYSDVQGGYPGEGNIDADPYFVEPGYWDPNGVWIDGDYHLLLGSPCIDAGDPNYVAEPNETDLDGRPRIIGGRIDMGAYESPVPAEVRIVSRTINLASKGKWLTCYISLPEDYNVADIDPNSVLLENEIQAASLSVNEQRQVAIVKFSRSEVQGILNVGDVELTITGQLTDGTVFEGTDVIRVLNKAGLKSAK